MTQVEYINVEHEDVLAVQRADFTAAATRSVIATILSQDIPVSAERFAEYEKKYQREYQEFEYAKEDIQTKYLSDPKYANATWNLNYRTLQLQVTYDDGN